MYIQYTIHAIPFIHYLAMVANGKPLKFRISKDNNSSIADDIRMKRHMHNHIMAIYIKYKYREIIFISYLFMAEDGKIIEI